MNKLKALVVVLASLGLAGLFVAGVRFHASTMKREVEGDPLVTNLRAPGFTAKLRYGVSPACGADGHECLTERDADERDWAEVPFPLPSGSDVRVQRGARDAAGEGKAGGAWAYYRIRVPVSPALLASGEEIGFTPMYVSHARFEAFVDGKRVHRGGATTKLFPSATVTIPREAVKDGAAVVTIKGSLDADHTGRWGTETSVPGTEPAHDPDTEPLTNPAKGLRPGTEVSVPEIILVEDSPFLRDAWADAPDMRVHTFAGPGELWQALRADPSLLTRVACVVTDLHFGDADPDANGHDVARGIRERAPGLPVLVATETPELAAVGGDAFDGALDKTPPPWPVLAQRLRRKNNATKSGS